MSLSSLEDASKLFVERTPDKRQLISKRVSFVDLTDDSPPQSQALDKKPQRPQKPQPQTMAEQLAEVREMHKRKAEAQEREGSDKRPSLDEGGGRPGGRSTDGARPWGAAVAGLGGDETRQRASQSNASGSGEAETESSAANGAGGARTGWQGHGRAKVQGMDAWKDKREDVVKPAPIGELLALDMREMDT